MKIHAKQDVSLGSRWLKKKKSERKGNIKTNGNRNQIARTGYQE